MTGDMYLRTDATGCNTATGGCTGPTYYSDIYNYTNYFNLTDVVTDLKRINDAIDEIKEMAKNAKLLYKNWLTEKEWMRELYIASVYKKLKAYSGYNKIITRFKTFKSTSPIIRNRWGGRK